VFPGPGNQKDLGRYLALGQVGMEMAAPIALGWLSEQYFGWAPWGVIAGAGVGFVGGLYHLVAMAKPRQTPKPPRSDDSGGRSSREGSA
jgi:hypothetical protein